jgi:hypothetical protein
VACVGTGILQWVADVPPATSSKLPAMNMPPKTGITFIPERCVVLCAVCRAPQAMEHQTRLLLQHNSGA